MSRTSRKARTAVALLLLVACNDRPPQQAHTSQPSAGSSDSVFALVQSRGHTAMGVDQYTSTHRFEPLPDGGRITLVRDQSDPAGVAQIRAHMTKIAAAFRRGDFTIPGFVHDRAVPGTDVMAARQSDIRYFTDTVPLGGSLRLQSTDTAVVAAIHQFLAFQRHDHRSPNVDTAR